jgi:hypothetical protein
MPAPIRHVRQCDMFERPGGEIVSGYDSYDVISRIDDIDADTAGVTKKVGTSHYMVSTKPRRTNLPFGIGQKNNDEATHNF